MCSNIVFEFVKIVQFVIDLFSEALDAQKCVTALIK